MKKDIIAWSILYGIILLSIIGCKPQKSVIEYKYLSKTDTLVRTQTNTVYQSVNDTTYINNPCDSTGILNQFYAKISIPFGSVKIRSRNNKLEAIVATKPIISEVNMEKSKSNSDSIKEVSKEVKVPYVPSWIIYCLIATSLLSFLYIKDKVSIFVK
ncbi:MAG: hypothetical protein RIR01_2088 [Bacteroidota bacterium]|jgi:hypothetical protein